MAADRKKARDQGWSIVLIDDSGFMLQPVVRRSWAPRVQTPTNTVGTVTIVYRLSRGLRWPGFADAWDSSQIHDHNIRFEEVMTFLPLVHQRLRRKFILVWDRYNAHRKAVRLLQAEHPDWFGVGWLPAYAPDLNPVELVWNRTKYSDMANFIPEDVHDLHQAITISLESTSAQSQPIRSFFCHARLGLCSFL